MKKSYGCGGRVEICVILLMYALVMVATVWPIKMNRVRQRLSEQKEDQYKKNFQISPIDEVFNNDRAASESIE